MLYADPKSDEERSRMGKLCVAKLGIKFPAVVDGFNNATERAYTGWPERLYLVGQDGKIVYKSGPGQIDSVHKMLQILCVELFLPEAENSLTLQ